MLRLGSFPCYPVHLYSDLIKAQLASLPVYPLGRRAGPIDVNLLAQGGKVFEGAEVRTEIIHFGALILSPGSVNILYKGPDSKSFDPEQPI